LAHETLPQAAYPSFQPFCMIHDRDLTSTQTGLCQDGRHGRVNVRLGLGLGFGPHFRV